MTGCKALLTSYIEKNGPAVTFGDNKRGRTRGYGVISNRNISFNDVAYVEGLKHNLLSISQLCDKGFLVDFKEEKCILKDRNGNHLLSADRS
ncbi:hypothetical protein, partial [Ancylomarina sp. 16SWW S1-10-2]|uniref:hypothetical protein n=1 Tax=Ancylomarina sp. 16SWW S1-10-2 TaxID=2499681 RepID=UPI001E344C3A